MADEGACSQEKERNMDSILGLFLAALLAYALYRQGRRRGSHLGYGAGRRRRNR